MARKNLHIEGESNLARRELVGRSKRIFLPGFAGLSLYEVLPQFIRQLKKSNLIERASGISFNIIMALPPSLIFAFTLLPLMPISDKFIEEIFSLVRDLIPGQKNHAVIIDFLRDFLKRPRAGLLSFGLVLAIFFSSNALMGILRAFDRGYPGFIRRSNLRRRRTALKLTIIVFVLIFCCLLLLIAQGEVLQWIGIKSAIFRSIINKVRWVIIFLLLFCVVSCIYHYGPSLSRRWPWITPGAFFSTSLMILATGIVSFWVNHFANYNKIYGSISAIFILMSLIYVNALAVLMGFELNVTLGNIRAKREADNV